jgi:hypothetical protein
LIWNNIIPTANFGSPYEASGANIFGVRRWSLTRIEPSFLSFSSREIGHDKKEDFMGEATDPEKTAEQAKEHIAGAAECLKETASTVGNAARQVAEATWRGRKEWGK